jgi:diadenylate cyclase
LVGRARDIRSRGVSETGVPIGAKATPELLTTIFFPNTPLHDGGVVLRGDQIVSAACVFPLTQRKGLSASTGMRHRAAMGLTEETDAVVVVVSEETGEISVAHRGHLVQGLDPDRLSAFLTTTLTTVTRRGNWLTDVLRRLFGNLLMRETSPKTEGDGTTTEGFTDQITGDAAERTEKRREEAQH